MTTPDHPDSLVSARGTRNSERVWTIQIEALIDISAAEVWPDNDGPANPTAEDVAQAMRDHGPMRRTLKDWNLDDDYEVTVDDVVVW